MLTLGNSALGSAHLSLKSPRSTVDGFAKGDTSASCGPASCSGSGDASVRARVEGVGIRVDGGKVWVVVVGGRGVSAVCVLLAPRSSKSFLSSRRGLSVSVPKVGSTNRTDSLRSNVMDREALVKGIGHAVHPRRRLPTATDDADRPSQRVLPPVKNGGPGTYIIDRVYIHMLLRLFRQKKRTWNIIEKKTMLLPAFLGT